MPSEETNKIKLKLIEWLKEEGFSAEEENQDADEF